MCQLNSIRVTEPNSKKTVKGYRIYQLPSRKWNSGGVRCGKDFPKQEKVTSEDLKDWEFNCYSFYGGLNLPQSLKWIPAKSSDPFHAFASFKDVKKWLVRQKERYESGVSNFTWLVVIVPVLLRKDVHKGNWDCCEEIHTITGYEAKFLKGNCYISKLSDAVLLKIGENNVLL